MSIVETPIPQEVRSSPSLLPARGGGFLRRLGLFGMEPIEDLLLAGLITCDPILLVGGHGSAKTLLANRLAGALGMRFHAYDASKALFEDVIGFPNPHSLKEGRVDYIPTPLSLWDKEFVLVDELSRATPSMQNKWLEVIRARTVMGLPIRRLRWILSAMNPPGYLGAMPIDAALAGRFAFIIAVPEAKDMEAGALLDLMDHLSDDDARGIAGNRFAPPPDIGEELTAFLDGAGNRLNELDETYGDHCKAYVVNLMAAFKLQRRPLDGRRLGMIRRNLTALLAVKAEKRGDALFDPVELDRFFEECLLSSLPNAITGETVDGNIAEYAHRTAMEALGNRSSTLPARLRIFLAHSPKEMVERFLAHHAQLTPSDHEDMVSHLEENIAAARTGQDILAAVRALAELVRLIQRGLVRTGPDVVRRTMSIYRTVLEANTAGDRNGAFLFQLFDEKEEEALRISRIDLHNDNDLFALHLAAGMKKTSHRVSQNRKTIVRRFNLLRAALWRASLPDRAALSDPE